MQSLSAWDVRRPLVYENEYELYHNATPKNATPAFHSHDFYEIYFFISGDASAYIEDYACRLKPRDVVIFPPGLMHRTFFHDPEVYYERMLIYISRDALRGMSNKAYSLLDVLESRIQDRRFHMSLSKENFETCRGMIDEVIFDAMNRVMPYQSLIDRCKVNLLMTLLCKWFDEAEEEQASLPQSRVANVIAYINAHLDETLTLDDLSERFFVSKYHLMHEFKTYTSRTIYQYILSKRISQAKWMLQSGLSPTDVCTQCGFKDYSSFYKAFVKEVNMPPRQYMAHAGRKG